MESMQLIPIIDDKITLAFISIINIQLKEIKNDK